MPHFIIRSVPRLNKFHRLFVVQLSSLQVENTNNDSFTVKYLIYKCGVSRDNAVSASKYVNFARPDKPDACLSFFKNHGFTHAQLLTLVTKYPRIIASDPEKTLLPKIHFLHSMGFLEKDITALLVAVPKILVRSLEGHLVPTFNLLKDHLGCVEATVKTITSHPRIFSNSQAPVLRHNIQLLKDVGVPSSCIASALRTQPFVFALSCDEMKYVVENIKKMGIHPSSWKSIAGVRSMRSLAKLEVYRRWDCSEEEVLAAFKRVPWCMKVSEEKIDRVIDFFVNEMGCTPQTVFLTPRLFSHSLQKKIVPRCSVYKLLLSKGLLKVKCSLYQVVRSSEDKFIEKYINRYPEEAHELLRLYEEKKKKSMN